MVFVGVYRAAYDYAPQSSEELALEEGDLLYILEKSTTDNWWKAKKKAAGVDEEDEPVGLIPDNYVEEVAATGVAKALYDYTRQTDEELSFKEDTSLTVYDTSDPDWTLVAIDNEYGFVPANYIEVDAAQSSRAESPSPLHSEDEATPTPDSPVQNPAAALANIIAARGRTPSSQKAAFPDGKPTRPTYTPEASDDEAPAQPSRARISAEPPKQVRETRAVPRPARSPSPVASPLGQPGRYRLYNVNEMVSALGKQKKLPVVLGINTSTGVITLAPAKSSESSQHEWTADKLSHYSLEGKHVFIELVKPSRSVDLHAGSKDTATEIVSALGELHGAAKAEGLREVLAVGRSGGQKMGRVLYDFDAAGDDEVSVKDGDQVVILNDRESDEWWQVRRVKDGKEGVVPSSYIDVIEVSTPTVPNVPVDSARSNVERNRLEEERLTRDAVKAAQKRESTDNNPPRGSSLAESGKNGSKGDKPGSKAKPNSSKVRTWTDRTGNFKVEAEFLGCREGKIHLHKLNGVKIAVPVVKMSQTDLDFVEKETGISLDEDKPLSDLKGRTPTVGATLAKDDYDWFDFFLNCGVDVHACQRYATNFSRDSMDEAVLPEITPNTLRSLGLKEGDILRVMRHLDTRFVRLGAKSKKNVSFAGEGAEDDANGSAGGLFSGPGGALRNNTRKGRPAPTIQTSDVVDAKAFLQSSEKSGTPVTQTETPQETKTQGGFEDDAWSVQPAKAAVSVAPPARSEPAVVVPPASDSARDLAALQQPLQPTAAPAPPDPVNTQPSGATPSMFAQIAQHNTAAPPRQRPTPPAAPGGGGLLPPPPARPVSAPQNTQSQFTPPPLVQQLTGYQAGQPTINQLNNQGTSMNDVEQQMRVRMLQAQTQQQQQQIQQLRAQMTGLMQPQLTGHAPLGMSYGGQIPPVPPVPGFATAGMLNGQQTGSPFANPPVQPFQAPNNFSMVPPPTGPINNYLPPALVPQATGLLQNQPTGMQPGFGQMPMNMPPVPPIPQSLTPAPLIPQRTGPAPPVRFGVAAKKLVPQPTGRANLSKATPDNPFGFD